jgi:hypothetical protein
MKRSDIKRIIKEEIIAALRGQINEDFADPIAREIHKNIGTTPSEQKKIFNAIARKYDIAWDKVPAGSFQDITGDSRLAKTGLVFYMSERRERVGGGYDQTINPGLLAVTLDGKTLYYGGSAPYRYGMPPADPFRGDKQRYKTSAVQGVTTDKGRSTSSPLGQGIRGTMQLKKLVELADKMYRFDLESFRGGTTAMKAKRAEMKVGTEMFTDPKRYKNANLDRYKKILATRVAGKDALDSVVKEGMQIINDAIVEGMSVVRTDQWGYPVASVNGKDIKISDLSYVMNRLFQKYEQYVSAVNQAEEEKKRYGSSAVDSYRASSIRGYALEVKQIVNSLKAGKV